MNRNFNIPQFLQKWWVPVFGLPAMKNCYLAYHVFIESQIQRLQMICNDLRDPTGIQVIMNDCYLHQISAMNDS